MQHYKAEESKLIDRNKRLELKLESWEEEFMKESEDIKTAYNKTLNSTAADLDEEENMRQRYQAEIQHLRVKNYNHVDSFILILLQELFISKILVMVICRLFVKKVC